MNQFTTKILGSDIDKEYDFECYENTERINIGDNFIFFFAGNACVGTCLSEHEEAEINENDRKYCGPGDLVTGFWKQCYKIKNTNYEIKD